MIESKLETCASNLENSFLELIRKAVRTEIQEIIKKEEDRLLTNRQVSQRLAISKDWIYRNGKKLAFTKKIGPKMVRFSEAGLQKWLKDKDPIRNRSHLGRRYWTSHTGHQGTANSRTVANNFCSRAYLTEII